MTEEHEWGNDGEFVGSPPCFMRELGPDGAPGVDFQQATDVARWRKAERERLIATRLALSAEYRAAQTLAIAADLDRLIPAEPGVSCSISWGWS